MRKDQMDKRDGLGGGVVGSVGGGHIGVRERGRGVVSPLLHFALSYWLSRIPSSCKAASFGHPVPQQDEARAPLSVVLLQQVQRFMREREAG